MRPCNTQKHVSFKEFPKPPVFDHGDDPVEFHEVEPAIENVM